ncbi:DNA (cytosine-5-)-methyltransferase [Nonomuraea sp. M3C6]|uniref:Cytosine-specific methyltransferase n=1 Tax=Nonomuraea marmarensis TaxID=3351344 RepID=A0ABW7ADJ5_9ACTN
MSPFLGPWIGSLCTGYGGLDMAVMDVYGARAAWCADNDPHVGKILDKRYPTVPNLGDLTAVDWKGVPRVDIVTAGFPCQDISYAGRHAGMRKDTRSGLCFTIVDALRVLQPGLVIVENVAALRSRGLDRVLGNLALLGYHTAWTCLRASDVGAPHRRERLFLLAAHPERTRLAQRGQPAEQEGRRPPAEPAGCGLRLPASNPGSVQSQRRGGPSDLAQPTSPPAATTGDATGHRDQTAADAAGQRQRDSGPPAEPGLSTTAVCGPATDPEGLRRDQGLPVADRLSGASDAAGNRRPDWGIYEPAVRRWEAVFGWPAPDPTELGTRGQPRLSARFVEWMMGLPSGWVTDIDIPRTAQMRALGNGVIPQQAKRALGLLIDLAGQHGEGEQ